MIETHPEHPAMRLDAPVSLDDLTEAARILLRRHQDSLSVRWRDDRWFDDEDLAAYVQRARTRWRPGARWPEAALFDETHAQEVVLSALDAPLFVVSSLDQLGIRARDAVDEEFWVGFALLDRPDWFDPIRLGGIPVGDVPYLRDVFGTTRFDLLLRLGWGYDALLDAVEQPGALDTRALRTMAALRATVA